MHSRAAVLLWRSRPDEKQRCRYVFGYGGANSNVCSFVHGAHSLSPLVGLGLTELPISRGATGSTPPLTSALRRRKKVAGIFGSNDVSGKQQKAASIFCLSRCFELLRFCAKLSVRMLDMRLVHNKSSNNACKSWVIICAD